MDLATEIKAHQQQPIAIQQINRYGQFMRRSPPPAAICVCCHVADEWDDNMARVAAAALVVAKGHSRLGDALVNLDRDIIAKIVSDEF